MSDLSTYAGQANHYAAVKARLWGAKEAKEPSKRVKARPVEPWQMWPPVRLPRIRERSFVKERLEPKPESPEYVRLVTTADTIIAEVAKAHRLTVPQLKSHRRWKEIVIARQEVFWRLSKETEMSLPMMGRKMGGFDHTTCLHSIRKHQQRIDAAAREPWVKPDAMRIVSERMV